MSEVTIGNEVKIYNVTLDDWVRNEPDKDLSFGWTQVCNRHAKEFPECMVDFGSGNGICGVKGCSQEAEHYVDFDREDIDPTN